MHGSKGDAASLPDEYKQEAKSKLLARMQGTWVTGVEANTHSVARLHLPRILLDGDCAGHHLLLGQHGLCLRLDGCAQRLCMAVRGAHVVLPVKGQQPGLLRYRLALFLLRRATQLG